MARLTLILTVLTTVIGLLGGFRWLMQELRLMHERKRLTGSWFLALCVFVAISDPAFAALFTKGKHGKPGGGGTAGATDILAASCNQSDVQAAVNLAASGDRVLVPAGTCNWTNRITIPSVAMTIKGAGTGVTTIVDQSDYTNSASWGLMAWTTVTGLSRITGFSFSSPVDG